MARTLRLITIVRAIGMVLCLPAAAGRAKGPGIVSIETTPWSQVRIDGRRIGRTPIRHHKLPAGAHRIELNNPVVGLKRTLEVIIHPGKHTRLNVELER